MEACGLGNSMKKKIAGVAVVAGILLVLAYLAWMRFGATSVPAYQPPAAEPPGHGVVGNAKVDSDPYDLEIIYTNKGFSTTSVAVKQGTRIRFLNKSSEEEWPASGIHPTHTLYPEKEATDCLGSSFDSCESLVSGEFYDFTFYYVGTWPFHDHLHGYNTGEIIVQ